MDAMGLKMNGFSEIDMNEAMEIDGGMFGVMPPVVNQVLPHVNQFLANRLVWTNAKNMYENIIPPLFGNKLVSA